ncbi:hypothetical protein BY996DRAFT_7075278 [Phakopsora pachyrhizi]|nr:hypothetical protein BY996DRAFT_7075278 [Phakopsora pachyrhizi]
MDGGNAKRARRAGGRTDPQSRTNASSSLVESNNTRELNRSSRSHALKFNQSRGAILQNSDSDSEDATYSKAKNSYLNNSTFKGGRAASARRALLNPSTDVILSSDREDHDEPIASTSNARETSPRLLRRRQQSPGGTKNQSRGRFTPLSQSDNSEGEQPVASTRRSRTGGEKPIKIKLSTDPLKTSKLKRPKPASELGPKIPANVTQNAEQPRSPNDPSASNDPPVKRRIAALMPATEPDEWGQYESSTCHQCRVKTTRPKMICDQSQDPNCVVRVCHTCLMVRTVYDDLPDLRAPIFTFVPGGTMLCVKCRDICPCASCRRRRGEKEQCRRGLGSGLKGFYGLTPEERELALARKKEKQDAARQKKETKTVEKKTPLVPRREVTSMRQGYDDDEHERLLHWAPLPVFPPLPKRRKRKRKRFEMIEGVRLKCKTSDTDTDTTCSDSDTNDDSDSDSRSMSSSSSFHSSTHTPGAAVLDPQSFSIPLSSKQRSTVPLINNRWRSSSSRYRKDDPTSFPSHLLRAIKRKPKSNKAPVVWIKRGAVIQARKPPTTEFMKKLAEEQKGQSSRDSTVAYPDLQSPATLENIPGQIASLALDCPDVIIRETELNQAVTLDHMPTPPVPYFSPIQDTDPGPTVNSTNDTHEMTSSIECVPQTAYNQAHPSGSIDCTQLAAQTFGEMRKPNLAGNEIVDLTGSNRMHPSNEHELQALNHCSSNEPGPVLALNSETQNEGVYFSGASMAAFQSLTAGFSPPDQISRHGFESGSPSIDHQVYLAGLTDEQLSAVLKEGNFAMAERGFLPSAISNVSESSMKLYDQHHFSNSTGISPELISTALPNGQSSNTSKDFLTKVNQGDKEKKRTEEANLADSLSVMLTDVPEDDQQMKRMIEAANWAAVWGATDGIGGFRLMDQITGRESRNSAQDQKISSPIWNDENGAAECGPGGSDKELFLRAMKSSVGDEWLTDVMPLDSY